MANVSNRRSKFGIGGGACIGFLALAKYIFKTRTLPGTLGTANLWRFNVNQMFAAKSGDFYATIKA
jgi:hypothetical protein